MRPASARYLAAVRSSHEAVTRVRLVTAGQTGVTPTGTTLTVLDGSVSIDGTADVRTTADLSVSEPWSDDGTGIAPYGQEIYVERGIAYGNGQHEWIGLGYLRLTDVEQADAPAGALRLAASDRMAGIIEAELLAPVQFAAGTTLSSVVSSLVTAVYPSAVIEWDDAAMAATSLARAAEAEEDRFAFLHELVTAQGKVMFFDHRGVLVIRTPPNPQTPVFDIDAGRNGVLVHVARGFSRESVFNAAVVTGEGADSIPPVLAVAYDLNPASLTYWHGSYGKVPQFYNSSFITTTAQATNAATSMLAKSLGLPYEVSFGMVPNVALEPLDAVQIVYPADLTKHPRVRREVHVIESLSIPLGDEAAPMTGVTRKQTLAVTT